MPLKIHFFNVGNGDSIVLELIKEHASEYIVIDSNIIVKGNTRICPSFNYLKDRGVKKIAAIIITHFHKDHYSGIESILSGFEIGTIFFPPVFSTKNKLFLDKQKAKIKEYINKRMVDGVNDTEAATIADLSSLLAAIFNRSGKHDIYEIDGPEQALRIPGTDIVGTVFLPLKKLKGKWRQNIADGLFDINLFPSANDSSIAFLLEYDRQRVLFAGDSMIEQWEEHKSWMQKNNIDSLNCMVIKAPHHGSKHSNSTDLYKYWIGSTTYVPTIVSANGNNFPNREFFSIVKEARIKPYCTNLSKYCKEERFLDMASIPEPMRPFLLHTIIPEPVDCMGDICVEISNSKLNISGSTSRKCIYDY